MEAALVASTRRHAKVASGKIVFSSASLHRAVIEVLTLRGYSHWYQVLLTRFRVGRLRFRGPRPVWKSTGFVRVCGAIENGALGPIFRCEANYDGPHHSAVHWQLGILIFQVFG